MSATRDFTYIDDTVDAFALALKKNIFGEVINIGNRFEISIKDILNIFATPKNDAAVDKLKPLSVFIFNFKNYANQLTPDQRQLLFKEDAKIIKKGSGNMYRYYLVVPHLTEEGFKETVIGGETELSMFEDISGIKVNKPIASKPFKPAPFKAGVPAGLQGLKEAIRRIILQELRKR